MCSRISTSRMAIAVLSAGILLQSATNCLATCLGATASKNVLLVEIVPQLPASVLYNSWAPLLEKLGNAAGLCFELYIPETIPTFETEFLAGKPDVVFLNPFHAVMAKRAQNYTPVLADGDTKLSGILVVKKDGTIKKLEDLQGQKIAFPSPNSFAASLLIRSDLARLGIKTEESYLESHSNVYRGVILRDYQAGGGVNNTFMRENPSIKDGLTVLYETKKFTPHPLCLHPRISEEIQSRIKAGFMNLKNTEEGRKLLFNVQLTNPIEVSYETNYAILEKMDLDQFSVKGAN